MSENDKYLIDRELRDIEGRLKRLWVSLNFTEEKDYFLKEVEQRLKDFIMSIKRG